MLSKRARDAEEARQQAEASAATVSQTYRGVMAMLSDGGDKKAADAVQQLADEKLALVKSLEEAQRINGRLERTM